MKWTNFDASEDPDHILFSVSKPSLSKPWYLNHEGEHLK